MAHDVFVSHSAKDKPTADAVCAVLESQGIRCWLAARDIIPGKDWGESIVEAIKGARVMVLVFSTDANNSPQIKREVERAVNKGIPIIPLRIEDVVPTASLEYFLSTPHWLDAFTLPLEKHLQHLAQVIRQITQAGEAKSVAVLPFVNMSSDKENEYLSDGITEDLCTALTQVKGLRVPARTSCFFFKGKTDDIRKIGQQLNVATVLEGSVSKAGNKLRINAQLINIADGFYLWATNYDREMSDLLALRSEIAQQVVAALRVQLLPGETQQLEKKPTVNPEAHLLYLKGRFFWNQRSGDSLKKATDYLEQALAQDPDYALAYAGLADCYNLLPGYAGVPTKEVLPKARAAALKAQELDNTLGEAHAALAGVEWSEWDWTGVEAEYTRAIELSPNYATAHQWYSQFLRDMGRLEEASRECQRACELDPLSPVINQNVGVLLYYNGHYDEAIAEYRKILELNPNFLGAHTCLGAAYVMKGMFTNAISEFQISRTLAGDSPYGLGWLGYACAVSGKIGEARKVLEALMHFLQQGYEVQSSIALVYHGLEDHEQTFNWLEQAPKGWAQFALSPFVKCDPVWQNLRSEPRFIALLKKMGLEK